MACRIAPGAAPTLFPLTLGQLAGSIALLLWGVHMVQTGVQRAFGARLRSALGTALRNRFAAFAAGLGVTAVMQSSTATGLMVTGFAAAGLVDLVPALAVMLGANVGTTLIVQVLSFNADEAAPLLILIGVLMFRRGETRTRDLGRVFIGLGLMLLALRDLLMLVTPFEDEPSLRLLLGAIATEPLLDVLLAAGLTWAAHSSVAIVLVVASLAAKGVVPPTAAFALVLGANLGTAINPCLEGPAGDDPAARRVPIGNLLTRVVGTIVAVIALDPIGRMMVVIEPDAARAVADFHTLFNVAIAAVAFPLLRPFARLLRRLLPTRVDPADPSRPLYLDPAAREIPVVAVTAAAREALRLADVLEAMLTGLRDLLEHDDRRRLAQMRRMDDVLDKIDGAIKDYLTTLDAEAMSEQDERRVGEILAFATNIEHAGDVVDKNLLGLAAKRIKRGVAFSPADQRELVAAVDRLLLNLKTAVAIFMTDDLRAARLLVAEKESFRELTARATSAQFARLRANDVAASRTGAMHLDALRDLSRVNSHLVAAAAYPVLESRGELLASRLRPDDDAPAEDGDAGDGDAGDGDAGDGDAEDGDAKDGQVETL